LGTVINKNLILRVMHDYENPENDKPAKQMVLTKSDYLSLKKLYESAIENKATKFVFNGTTFITDYAKYVIEYLDEIYHIYQLEDFDINDFVELENGSQGYINAFADGDYMNMKSTNDGDEIFKPKDVIRLIKSDRIR
jgi:hypothetical protein